jgi:hypothetical protein
VQVSVVCLIHLPEHDQLAVWSAYELRQAALSAEDANTIESQMQLGILYRLLAAGEQSIRCFRLADYFVLAKEEDQPIFPGCSIEQIDSVFDLVLQQALQQAG